MNFSLKIVLLGFTLLSSTLTRRVLSNDAEFESHPSQDFEPQIIDVEEDLFNGERRVLLGYPKIRIAVDFEHLTEGTDEFKTYVKTQLVPSVVSYFSSSLKIKQPLIAPITVTSAQLCGFDTPQVLKTGVKADLFIFFNSKTDTTGGWMAATSSCALTSGAQRPLIVNIGINTVAIGTASVDKNPLTHDLYINVLAHEFIHGFAMNGVLYKYFIDANGNKLTNHIKELEISGANRTVLDMEPLTTRLREFYGCPSVPGIIMENGGGAHLERRYFQYEVMSTGGILGSKISEISFAFLEGSGWYIPDYSFAESYFFGKGQGCGFIFDTCDAGVFDEYCSGIDLGCTEVGLSGGYCKTDSKAESCRFYSSQTEFNCENPSGIYYSSFASKQVYGRGLGSKCFSGNLTTKKTGTVSPMTYCFTYNCLGEGTNTTLEVNFGTSTFTCQEKGPLSLPGYNGFVNCPDPAKFCQTIGKPTCPRNCMGQGQCVNGKCQCNSGFQGTDCGFTM